MTVRYEMDLNGAGHELDRLARGPVTHVEVFEGILLETYIATQERVHVLTGFLKSSGRPSSSFDGETWEGTLTYARYPGIFELARGNRPTGNHPEGQHHFLAPAQDDVEPYKAAVIEFLQG